jgi:hypothetical protein
VEGFWRSLGAAVVREDPAVHDRAIAVVALLAAAMFAAACNPRQVGGLTERLSIATGGTGGVYYPYGGGIAKVITTYVEGVEATAEVTAGTVDNLKFLANRSADLAFALSDSLDDGVRGRGPFADFGAVSARALAVLYDNYNHLVTLAGSDIDRVADLKGKVVSTGAPGSGTEVSAFRILEAAGVHPETDIQKQALGAAQSADALRDGKIDAFFWSGGIPTGALLDLASRRGRAMKLVPNGELLAALQHRYGSGVYHASMIPKETYPGTGADVSVISVSNVLAAHEALSEDLAYRITKALFDHHAELAAIHPEAAKLALDTAVQGSPIPFHPGAVRFYKERGVWREEQ